MRSRFLAVLASVGALAVAGGGNALGDTITFGAPLCLTGDQAPLDTPGFRGAQVAIKALNDQGGLLGQQVEMIDIDGKTDPVTVGNAAV